MQLIINSKILGRLDFWIPTGGGYIRVGDKQICSGGKFVGETLRASPDTFESVVRAWVRARLRLKRKER